MNQWQARENMYLLSSAGKHEPVPSAGKHETYAKRGKTSVSQIIEIFDCLKREQDVCVKTIIPSQNTAFLCTPLKFGFLIKKLQRLFINR